MFRVSQMMREIIEPTPVGPRRDLPGPVVIWNLTRRCNLACKHCYAVASNQVFPGELSTAEALAVLDDLYASKVRVLILSGGEPLMRHDIWELSERAQALGFYTALSTNGTTIDETNIDRIAAIGYDYVGISLDGLRDTHDKFRRMPGAFDRSLHAIRLCVERGIKVGLRFTLTKDNAHDFPALLNLMRNEGVHKFYLSHLNYGGRGNVHRSDDAHFTATRQALDLMFTTAWRDVVAGYEREYTTGNNDADGAYFLIWAAARFPDCIEHLRGKLRQWGGNASGINVANIDNLGNVHPDTMWWHHTIGNVRQRSFGEIWADTSDPLMAGLKVRPRAVGGRCAACTYLDVCGGNTRVRAQQISGDPWAEDPGCYLTDSEIGIEDSSERLQVAAFSAGTRKPDRAFAQTLKHIAGSDT